MSVQRYLIAGFLAAAVVGGCKKSDSSDVTPPAAPSTTPPAMTTTMGTNMGANMTVPATMPTDTTVTTPAMPATPAMPTMPNMPNMPTTMPSGSDAQAQGLIDKAKSAMTSMNWSDAQKYVQQLDNMKGSLSPAMQTQVDSLDKMLAQGKSMGGGLGGLMGH